MAETKENIIKIGDQLIRQKGFNAFSYHDIAQKLGVKNAAIHYHFPTKADLLIEVAKYHIQKLKDFEQDNMGLSAYKKVIAFIDTYVKINAEGRVCFVGAMATDWETVEDTVRPYMQQMATMLIDWLTTTLQKGLESKELQFKEQPHTQALLIISNLLAATQMARITGDENFEIIKNAVLNGIKPHNK